MKRAREAAAEEEEEEEEEGCETAGSAVQQTKESSVAWFRLRRAGLVQGHRHASHAAAVRAACGLQSQELASSLLSLRLRMEPAASAETAEEIERTALLSSQDPQLVRVYAQRTTIHLYPTRDWRNVAALCEAGIWKSGCTAKFAHDASASRRCAELLRNAGAHGLTRADVVAAGAATKRQEQEVRGYLKVHGAANAQSSPCRMVAAGMLRDLCRTGVAAMAGMRGREQCYVAREFLAPRLAWPESVDLEDAGLRFAREFLRSYSPATVADIRRYFGTSVSTSRGWIAALRERDEIVDVECVGRPVGNFGTLLALRQDSEAIAEEPPAWFSESVVLLPRYDSFTLAHADKTWVVASEEAVGSVFAPCARVEAIALVGGKAAAIWQHHKQGSALSLSLKSLPGASEHDAGLARAALVREAPRIATFFGATTSSVD